MKKRLLPETDIYCITSEEHSRERNNIEVVKQMIDTGIKIVQYREKEKEMGEKYEQCLKIREMTKAAGVFFIVNDHADIAMMVEADGIHVGQDDLPIEAVRKMVGNDMVIGMSTHSPSQAEEAISKGVDYIGVGPIYRTYTKKNVCDPVGIPYLDYAKESVNIPFVTLGGIKAHNVSEVVHHGATCVALVTEIVGAENIGVKIEEIRKRMRKG